jgi:hypothetical protein
LGRGRGTAPAIYSEETLAAAVANARHLAGIAAQGRNRHYLALDLLARRMWIREDAAQEALLWYDQQARNQLNARRKRDREAPYKMAERAGRRVARVLAPGDRSKRAQTMRRVIEESYSLNALYTLVDPREIYPDQDADALELLLRVTAGSSTSRPGREVRDVFAPVERRRARDLRPGSPSNQRLLRNVRLSEIRDARDLVMAWYLLHEALKLLCEIWPELSEDLGVFEMMSPWLSYTLYDLHGTSAPYRAIWPALTIDVLHTWSVMRFSIADFFAVFLMSVLYSDLVHLVIMLVAEGSVGTVGSERARMLLSLMGSGSDPDEAGRELVKQLAQEPSVWGWLDILSDSWNRVLETAEPRVRAFLEIDVVPQEFVEVVEEAFGRPFPFTGLQALGGG